MKLTNIMKLAPETKRDLFNVIYSGTRFQEALPKLETTRAAHPIATRLDVELAIELASSAEERAEAKACIPYRYGDVWVEAMAAAGHGE